MEWVDSVPESVSKFSLEAGLVFTIFRVKFDVAMTSLHVTDLCPDVERVVTGDGYVSGGHNGFVGSRCIICVDF